MQPTNCLRTRPYPSSGIRLELSPTTSSNSYELRSKRSPGYVSSHSYGLETSAASSMPPNAEALIGRSRALKKKYT
ncbi:unnamed protein product, partial [Mesorhabditis belari]|uniref:Uncharacterized protein n=1 Tax=Mesorhabditis belari TaxID=2138241 RepID=A0AAF3F1R9_9BILA